MYFHESPRSETPVPDLLARITTAMKFPAVLLDVKEREAEVAVPALLC